MRIGVFVHSLRSCWNHGNAHFLRGVMRDLQELGHSVVARESPGAWSAAELVRDRGPAALDAFAADFPELAETIAPPDADAVALARHCDVVLVHEWNDPTLVASLGQARKQGGDFLLLFHDTHHRAVSAPDEIRAFDLSAYDAILAFGESLSHAYRSLGFPAFTWHEAADTRLFRPSAEEGERQGLVWIGNWGDGERTAELETFLLEPARQAGLSLDIHGVRYPEEALATLRRYGARYHGWIANAQVPARFAQHRATVHVPRRFYANLLPGIPTIRVFEALACGIPLVSAPWQDSENLFRPGQDFLMAETGEEMRAHLCRLRDDPALCHSLATHGLQTIRARHTTAHRARELLAIVDQLNAQGRQAA